MPKCAKMVFLPIKFEPMNRFKRSIERCTREIYRFQSPKVPIVQIPFRGTKNAEKCQNGVSAIKFEPMNRFKRSIERCTREIYRFQSPKVPIVQIPFRGTKNAEKCQNVSIKFEPMNRFERSITQFYSFKK
jgi:RNase P protein component